MVCGVAFDTPLVVNEISAFPVDILCCLAYFIDFIDSCPTLEEQLNN